MGQAGEVGWGTAAGRIEILHVAFLRLDGLLDQPPDRARDVMRFQICFPVGACQGGCGNEVGECPRKGLYAGAARLRKAPGQGPDKLLEISKS